MSTTDSVYNPQNSQEQIYAQWEQAGYFHAQRDPKKKPYTIVMPPPNITGRLHMGHALNNSIQDVLIRFKRMQGFDALWVPGTDHASIATEVKVVEKLLEEGITKSQIGREAFLEHAWAWKRMYGDHIVHQLRQLGCSCDWDRLRFTMDEGCSRAVIDVFVRLYEKGLVYRGHRIINWCPECRTALSDAEVEYEEEQGHLWHIRYPRVDGRGYIVVATTRPETMLGDTAVAVHPDDARYRELVGKAVLLPLMDREIPVVADHYVDPEFGSGAVKITPAHDPNDFEVGQRHDLPVLRVMADDASMNEQAGRFAGLPRYEARKIIIQELTALGLIERIEEHTHNVGHCYRCHDTVEPIISEQWFVRMKPLAEPAIASVREGRVKVVPERFEKVYYNWMENIRDWCISRQLWWGHRIPAYYCDSCGKTIVARETPERCACGGALRQDEDVLDTWFSSALWPFSTLGWPEKTEDMDIFYPTDVLVTSYDIIFFWVARMIFSGLEYTGMEPFHTVFFNGLVRDSQGKKMSKSSGNGMDPLEIIEQSGADALRFSLMTGTSPGNDMRYYQEKVDSARNFANKIWNAARFVQMNLDGKELLPMEQCRLELPDQWMLSRYGKLIGEVTENLERFELGLAAQNLYESIWNEYCDWYIELTKSRLYGGDEIAKRTALSVLCAVLSGMMRLLHPFMPFLTEQVYQALPGGEPSVMIAPWPNETYAYDAEEAQMDSIMQMIRAVRNLRAERNVSPARRTRMLILPRDEEIRAHLAQADAYLKHLAWASETLLLHERGEAARGCVTAVCACATIFIPLGELVDLAQEIGRVQSELERCKGEIGRAQGMLNNQGFMSKAPEAVVEEQRKKLQANEEMLMKLEENLRELQDLQA